jgi:hypothetical protein
MSDKETYIIGSKIKALLKSKGLMCSGELPDAVSAKVREMLDAACERTTSNKRSTVRPHDL